MERTEFEEVLNEFKEQAARIRNLAQPVILSMAARAIEDLSSYLSSIADAVERKKNP